MVPAAGKVFQREPPRAGAVEVCAGGMDPPVSWIKKRAVSQTPATAWTSVIYLDRPIQIPGMKKSVEGGQRDLHEGFEGTDVGCDLRGDEQPVEEGDEEG